MWVHKSRTTSQLSRVQGYHLQGPCLAVITVRDKTNIIWHGAINSNSKWLSRPIPFERDDQASHLEKYYSSLLHMPSQRDVENIGRSVLENGSDEISIKVQKITVIRQLLVFHKLSSASL